MFTLQSVTVEVDLTAATTTPKTIPIFGAYYLPGSWKCTYSSDGKTLDLEVSWSGVGLSKVKADIALYTSGSLLSSVSMPESLTSPDKITHKYAYAYATYIGECNLRITLTGDLTRGVQRTFVKLAEQASVDSQCPHDVLIQFARGRQLWASSKALSSASTYFKDLFGSGFAEANVTPPTASLAGSSGAGAIKDSSSGKEVSSSGKEVSRKEEEEEEAEEAGEIWDGAESDSDEETDTLIKQGDGEKVASTKSGYHTIESPVSYTTYRAVLVFILSYHIEWAPLLSASRAATYPSAAEARSSHDHKLRVRLAENPNLPSPASPKPVYRLAHLLQLPRLEALALAEIRRQLCVENAAYELYGSVTALYDAIREAVLDFCVANWELVRETSAMKEMEQRADAGQLSPKAMVTAMQLAKRLSKN